MLDLIIAQSGEFFFFFGKVSFGKVSFFGWGFFFLGGFFGGKVSFWGGKTPKTAP